jgi:hypothetical protein
MSADDLPIPDPPGRAQLDRLLSRRGVNPTCPICAQTNWGNYLDVAMMALRDRDPATGAVDAEGSVHALSVSCLTCGYLALFTYDVLELADPPQGSD